MKLIEFVCDATGVQWIAPGVKATYDGDVLMVDVYSKYRTACRYTAATASHGETVTIKVCSEGIHIGQRKNRLQSWHSESGKDVDTLIIRDKKGFVKMDLNIQDITDAKIKEMHESGEIRKRIEEGVSKTVLGAIDSALNGWEIRKEIEKSVSDNVSGIVKEIGFSGYNGFIAQTIKDITEGVMQEDVAQKIQKVFNDMLIVKHEGIKLSDIFKKYREYILEETDEPDKWEYRNFLCDLSIEEDGSFTRYKIKLNKKELGSYDEPEIELRFLDYRDKGKAKISLLYLDGHSIDKSLSFGRLNPVESLLANLFFNETEIILDADDVNDDNYYDIDD